MNKPFIAVTAPRSLSDGDSGAARCFVHDLVMEALVGVYDHEHANRQRIRVNVDLELVRPGVRGEDAAATVRGVLEAGHVTLVETLAERIAQRLLDDARVRCVQVRVEKLDIFPDAKIGIEIVRWRP